MSAKDLAAMVGSEKAAALLGASVPVTARASSAMRLPRKRTQTKAEFNYEAVLMAEFRPTEGYRVEFETLTLILASGTRYTPDFTVWHGTALVLAVEVKGKIKLKSLDRATTKFKEAITSFPHIKFRHAFQDKLSGWGVQERRHNDPPA